ncbi:MAG: hypothetical protein NDJ65_01400 [Paludibacteraceae bacterium]|nr:hypothetical protein [Paludibacteraceae bacterium]
MKKQDTKYQNAPYAESDEYVDTLVRKATENAITKGKERKGKKRIILTLTSIGAAAACLIAVINTGRIMENRIGTKDNAGKNIAKASVTNKQAKVVNKKSDTQTNQAELSPLDEFMANTSLEEKTMIAYYEVDEIPEY